jgi:hypothetical protein
MRSMALTDRALYLPKGQQQVQRRQIDTVVASRSDVSSAD